MSVPPVGGYEVRLATNVYPHTYQSQSVVLMDEYKAKPPYGSRQVIVQVLNLIGVGVTIY